jgi:hypothetical protein
MNSRHVVPLWVLISGGCSDPLYYPQITKEYGDTSSSGPDPDDPWGLIAGGVPCSDDSNPVPATFTVDNQHPTGVELWLYWTDCSLIYQAQVPAGQNILNGYGGQTAIFTDSPATTMLAWVQVAADGTSMVVVP